MTTDALLFARIVARVAYYIINTTHAVCDCCNAAAPLNTDLTKHISDTARRFPAGRRTFTDGSLIDREGVGASYYDKQTKQTTYIKVDQKDILRAELPPRLPSIRHRAKGTHED
jgi:hypothetical protein